jgi:hypothetical protein
MMQTSENSEELYDELAKRIHVKDDMGARRAFRELLDAGRPRQEIVSRVSRLIEKQSAGKTLPNATEDIRWLRPHRSIEPSPAERHKKPTASPTRPELARADADPVQRAGALCELNPPHATAALGETEKPLTKNKAAADPGIAVQGSGERRDTFLGNISPRQVSSGHSDLSVPERLASKLQLQTELAAVEAKQTALAEAVVVQDRPRPAQHSPGGSPPGAVMIMTITAIFAAAAAGAVIAWSLYRTQLEDVSLASAQRALMWLQEVRGTNVSSSPDATRPIEKTAQPEQATAVHESNELPKQLEASVEASTTRPRTDLSTPQTGATGTQHAVAGSAGTRTEPNTAATSTRATAEIAETTPLGMEAPASEIAERAVVPGTNLFSQQNETDTAQRPQTAGPQLPSIDTRALVAQGDQLPSKSDVASARLLYERAAEAGDGRGALRMGMTFDPVFLARWGLRGVRADRAQAISWYRRASALGNADAQLMQREEVRSLSRRMGSASGSIPAQPPRVAARGQRTSHGPRRAAARHHAKGG